MTKVTMETDLYEDGDMFYFLDMDMAILAANRESKNCNNSLLM